LELQFHVVGSLDALLGILGEASAKQAIKRTWGKRLERRDRLGFVFQDGRNDAGLALSVERVVSRHHLVQHCAAREEITARGGFLGLQLLGSPLLHGSYKGPLPRDRAASHRGDGNGLAADNSFR